jgi:tape measure domain-containing protein
VAVGPLDEAFVEVSADVSRAERNLDGLHNEMEDVERAGEEAAESIEASFEEATRDVRRSFERMGDGAFDDVADDSQRAARQIVDDMVRAGQLSDAALEEIGGADVFAELVAQARAAATGIDVAFRDAGGRLRNGAGQFIPPGAFTGVVVESAAAAREIEAAFRTAGVISDAALTEIGGADAFATAVASAEVAAESIEHSFRDSADDSVRALARIGTAGASFSLLGTGAAAAALAVGAAAAATVGFGLAGAASLETTTVGFEALLGSAQEADAFIREMQAFAANTPFDFQGLADNARRLLATAEAAGLARDEILPTIEVIGDLAAVLGATPESITRVVRALGQMASRGKVSTEEMLQLAEALPGFAPFQAMADGLGLTTAELQEQITGGLIPAKEGIDALLEGMADFPGAAGAMAAQAQTLTGVLSTFKDTVQIALTEAFQPLVPEIKDLLRAATPVIEDALGTLAPALGSAASGILGSVLGVFEGLTPGLAAIFAGLGEAFDVLAGPLADLATDLSTAFAPVEQLLPALAEALVPVMDAIGQLAVALIPPLIEAMTSLATAVTPVLVVLAEVVGVLADAFAPVLELLSDQVGLLADAFGEAFQAMDDSGTLDLLADSLQDLAIAAQPLVQAFGSLLVTAVEELLPPLLQLAELGLGTLATLISEVLIPLMPTFEEALRTIADALAVVLPPLAELIGSIGEALLPVIAELVEALAPVVAEQIGQFAKAFALITEALVPVLPALSELALAIGDALVDAIEELGPSLPELATAFTDMAIAMTELFVAVTPLLVPMIELATLITSEITAPVLIELAEAIGYVAEKFAMLAEGMRRTAEALSTYLAPGIEVLAGLLGGLGGVAVDQVVNAFQTLGDIAEGALNGALSALAHGVAGLIVAMDILQSGPIRLVIAAGLTMAGVFNGVLQAGIQAVMSAGQFLSAVFTGALQVAMNTVTNVGRVLNTFVLTPMGNLLSGVVAGGAIVAQVAMASFRGAIAGVTGVAQGVLGVLRSIGGFLTDTLAGALSVAAGAWRGIQSAVSGALGVLGAIVGAAQRAADAVGRVIGAIGDLPGAGFLGGLIGALPFAAGGIVTEPTFAVLGEQSRREVVLPLTDPARTLALAEQSGLFDVLARAGAFANRGPANGGTTVTRQVTGGDSTSVVVHATFGVVPSRAEARAAADEIGEGVAAVLDRRLARVTAQIAS